MNGISERIMTLMDYYGLDATGLSKRIVFNQSNLSKVLSGKRQVPKTLVNKITSCFNVRPAWLLTGEGEMLKSEGEPPAVLPDFLQSDAVPSEPVEVEYAGENKNHGVFFRDKKNGQLYISVPHMPYAARGEFPNLADSLEPLSELGREVYRVDRKAYGNYLSFDVRGDSMDNGMKKSLSNGDKILVRELERDNWRTLRTGDHRFWVLVFGSSVLIKEISEFDPQTGVITCHSLNPSPEYHDFTLSLDEVRYLFYVIRIKPADIEL